MASESKARQRAESLRQEKDRELSMLTVDYKQMQYRVEKLEADNRQESEKARGAIAQLERLREEKSLMQSDHSVKDSEITLLKTNEKRMLRDLSDYRERTKSLEEELHKVKAARSVDDLQRKELEDQLEAEQYFSTLYKTQVRELQEEVDEAKERHTELDRDKETLVQQLQQASTRADSEALSRRVAEEDIAELEKEKMMIELELKDVGAKHKADARNLEIQLASLKDTESDLLQKIDQLSKENTDLQMKLQTVLENQDMQEQQQNDVSDNVDEVSKMRKLLDTERMLKQQAVNKLAEIMNRKDFLNKEDKKSKSKASSVELRKKEKENRRMQQELTMEKEKFNQMVAKYQKDLQDLQATLYEESQAKLKLSMELDTKESELEGLQIKMAGVNLDTASLSSGTGDHELDHADHNMEGWLQVPSKQNIRRHGWKKLYVVVSSKKIIFFNSETERQNADPTLILDLRLVVILSDIFRLSESKFGSCCLLKRTITCDFTCASYIHACDYFLFSKVFHVRSVTQGDVIRAEAKDIPRIFQVCLLPFWFVVLIFIITSYFCRFCTPARVSHASLTTTPLPLSRHSRMERVPVSCSRGTSSCRFPSTCLRLATAVPNHYGRRSGRRRHWSANVRTPFQSRS